MSEKNKFYVTTPIYYGTAKPHLGSLYSTLIADVLARWNRLLNKKVFFLTGTDEHGQKIEEAAQKVGKTPKQLVDSYIDDYKTAWRAYEIDYTKFIRTTDDYHIKGVRTWIADLQNKGDIYKAFYEGWYCVPCETFVATKNTDVAPDCPACNRKTKSLSEESYFFRLSAYQDRLLTFYKEHPNFIVPKERMKEVVNFVESGLRDLSISRTTVQWGIAFPNDVKHVAYVWADALANYITAIGYEQKEYHKTFTFWWPADVQVIGKDILRFHAVYWPAFLMASGLSLPKTLLVHGWIKIDDQKMSKSLGNVVDPMVLHGEYGADPVRYYLMKKMSITHDSLFSIQDLEQTITSDLANDLGNLLNRMLRLAEKNGVKVVHAPKVWSESVIQLRISCLTMVEEVEKYFDEYMFHMALNSLSKVINRVNAYFHESQPWKLVKPKTTQSPGLEHLQSKFPEVGSEAFCEVLSATMHSLKVIAILLWPVMPSKMVQLLDSLGLELTVSENCIDQIMSDPWRDTFTIKEISPLFEKPVIRK